MLSSILDEFDLKLPDEKLAELVQKALATPEMNPEQFDNVLELLGELEWIGSGFAPSLKYFIDYVENSSSKDKSRLLGSLAHWIRVFCETEPLACKPEFEEDFKNSLKKSIQIFANSFCETRCIYCLIGMAAASGKPKAARVLWDLQSGYS